MTILRCAPIIGLALALMMPWGSAAAQPLDVGFDGLQAEATGFFRTEHRDGAWWLVTPDGRGYYAVGVSHVRFTGQGCERLGYSPYEEACKVKYGSPEAWTDATVERLSQWGFNMLGELCDRSLRHRGLVHTDFRPVGYLFAKKDGLPTPSPQAFTVFPNVFSPEWPRHCEAVAREWCAPQKDDPALLGYFLDNELTWFGPIGREWGLFCEAWKKPAEDPAKQAWIQFLQERLESPADMEEHWRIRVGSWQELADHTDARPPLTPRARELTTEWLREVARAYFEPLVSAIRRHDPNHLILGVRFANEIPDILEVVGEYCDVVSVNFYPRIEPGGQIHPRERELLEEWHRKAGKPLLISEWSFPAFDSGLPSTIGAGMRVETQAQRAQCWSSFQETLFRLPFIVGSNYFTWSDEPAFGIASHHPENTNFGLVDETDTPYEAVVNTAREINPRVYEWHTEGPVSEESEVPDPSARFELPPLRPLPDEPWTATCGALTVEARTDEGAWVLAFRGQPLARIQPRVFQIYGNYIWSKPTRLKPLRLGENDSMIVLDAELTNAEGPRRAGEGLHRSTWRLWVPKHALNAVAVQCLSIENAGETPWRLLELQVCLESDIGANDTPDEPFGLAHRWVPFYRHGSFIWDRAEKLGVGATFREPEDFFHFFRTEASGGAVGELQRRIDTFLPPGAVYEEGTPPAVIFLMEHDSPAHFARRVERLRPVFPGG